MQDPHELEADFWSALDSDRTMMLGLVGVDEGHTRPMTAQIEGKSGPIWFFASTDSELVRKIGTSDRAIATFQSKGHDIFASVHGKLSTSHDRAVIDRLWNPFVAAWYEGKDDPKLVLLRMEPDQAEIWKDGSSLVAGIKMLFGIDPKTDYKDNVAKVSLS
ncbi:pyridoxamine 5'-phosphate oxidase family protein [Cypionkella sp.]|uniref:pyridoxamine 5'-phosphate oxidase family protein n=1 Tax=Cypionkella sp. TaxID=2811411 RepID=UPI0026287478|nr:pyridoxamine 5'-phosphate oxidase family protein [Cypionkella sp.]MDB5664050.1 ral stress protein [Cypionkella sp.]